MSKENKEKRVNLNLTQAELKCILRWAEEATKGIFSAYDGFTALTPLEQKIIDKLNTCEKEFLNK